MNLATYYETICKSPILTREEEQSLLKTFFDKTASDADRAAAREKLIISNLRFVFKQAKMHADSNPDQFEDLISAGNEGLIVGLDKFSSEATTRLLSYAGWWIYQRQTSEQAKFRLVALPIWKQQLAQRIVKAQTAGDKPLNLKQLQELFPEVSERDLRDLSSTRYLTYFMEDLPEEEVTYDPYQSEVEESLEHNILYKHLSSLPEMQKKVLLLLFGFDDGEEKNLSDVSKELGISVKSVKEHRDAGLATLRDTYKVQL